MGRHCTTRPSTYSFLVPPQAKGDHCAGTRPRTHSQTRLETSCLEALEGSLHYLTHRRSEGVQIESALHDNVVHKKKRVVVAGKATWVNPRYTKSWTHTLPGGKKLHVRAGTQIIDRFWGHLRTYLKHAPRKVGSTALMRKIRAAQWTTGTASRIPGLQRLPCWESCDRARAVPKNACALQVSLFVCMWQNCTYSISSTAFVCSHLIVCFNCNLFFKPVSPHCILLILANILQTWQRYRGMKLCIQWHILLERSKNFWQVMSIWSASAMSSA